MPQNLADTGAFGLLGYSHVARDRGRAGPDEGPPSLSARLRSDTACAHRAIEASLGLPHAISNRADCAACLGRFLGLYRPLEAQLREWGDWSDLGIDFDRRAHVPRLVADLGRFRVDPSALPTPARGTCRPCRPSPMGSAPFTCWKARLSAAK